MQQSGDQFITHFEKCKFRYLDLTGAGRAPVSSDVQRDDLNNIGYCAFFTVNGFEGVDATENSCVNLTSFFVDIDYKLTPDEIEKIKAILEPSFIVETFHGFHFYWLLDEIVSKADLTPEEWEEAKTKWKRIEQSIVNTISNTDKSVKDIPRILRLPGSYYWKKTDDLYKTVVTEPFKITGVYKNTAANYTMDEVEEAFPVKETEVAINDIPKPVSDKAKKMAQVSKNDFFKRVNDEFPMVERESFKVLSNATPDSIPLNFGRNNALLVTASLMRQANWPVEKAIEHIKTVGWHNMEKENGGYREIIYTINQAYKNGYFYSYKHELIGRNMSPEESLTIQQVYTKVMKARKEEDKIIYSNYEREILIKYPNLKKNTAGMFFDYSNGVYKMLTDQNMSDMFMTGMFDDMLWGYRTNKSVSDKVSCLLSIIPELKITDNGGFFVNVKNGLLNITTRELLPHTPEYVSLIQYPVEYNPEATCPVWDKCVSEWMSGLEQESKIRLLKQFSGYILSSSMLYDKALFMVGDGGNGKSTFIDTISMVLGKEATSHIDLEDLYSSFGMHGLIGKRLNIIEEVHGNYYNSNKLKKVISGEPITVNIKYKDQFTFRPQAKFVFSVNLLPRVDDTSQGTERRICAVQFLNNYRDNPNYALRSSIGLLAQELSGILNWMIDGYWDLTDNREFVVTQEQIKMLNDYREENSSVEGFLAQCIILEPGSKIECPALYGEYKKWSMTDGGRKSKANFTFTKEVKAYGAKGNRFNWYARQNSKDEAYFDGIALCPQWIKHRDNPYNETTYSPPNLEF